LPPRADGAQGLPPRADGAQGLPPRADGAQGLPPRVWAAAVAGISVEAASEALTVSAMAGSERLSARRARAFRAICFDSIGYHSS